MIKKFLSILHLSNLAYNLSKLCCRIKTQQMDYKESLDLLNDYSKDSHGSCICEHNFNEIDCDVEIIVPCYNVEKYVEECIQSILAQKTQYKFFVTIVNDGSTDGTSDILKKYEGLNGIKVLTQRNTGLSGARNAGIAQAHGRYLMFVDSDDLLYEHAIEKLVSLAEKTCADVVDSGHIRFADKINGESLKAKIYDYFQKPQALPYNEHSSWITGFPCGKIFKRDIFARIEFPRGYWFEDTLVCMIIEPFCKIKATSDILSFAYRMNMNSISHVSKGSPKSLDGMYITLQLLRDRKTLNIPFSSVADYEMILKQLIINHKRIIHLPKNIQNAAFIVHSEFICNEFCNFRTSNESLKLVEKFLKNKDFRAFYIYCKWH